MKDPTTDSNEDSDNIVKLIAGFVVLVFGAAIIGIIIFIIQKIIDLWRC